MAIYTVDSEAVHLATSQIRATADRISSDTSTMTTQLTQLQASWTGSASTAFQGVVERWRSAQRNLEAALGDIGTALGTAGTQYAQTEQAAMGLFR